MIAWFTRNGVAANLLMAVMVFGGIFSLMNIKRELFPEFSLDIITVTVPYLGASPEEVEEAVVVRIEEAVQGLDGIKEITSSAFEGAGLVSITVNKGFDLSKLKDQVKTRVDAITTFPAETERPIVDEVLIERDTIWVSLYGDTDERSIKRLAERIRDDLMDLDGISQAVIQGVRDYEITIEVSEEDMEQYGITFDDVVNAVRAYSVDLPGGLIRSSGGEIALRTEEQLYSSSEFEDIVLMSTPTGGKVYLQDVATVVDGFTDETLITRFNGKTSASILVKEVGDENPIEISQLVYDYVDKLKEGGLPAGIEVEAWGDASFYLQGRLSLLVNNGLIGFGLVLISLALFLRPSLAFFVAIGIPVSFLGTFMVGPFIGLSINLISLFAFILVLGIVVDDAIVVGESVFTEFQKNGPGVDSAIRGTHLVSTPVTFAILTTIVAFLPIFFLPGLIGKFFLTIPLVVIPTLLFSLVQSKLVLPYHLSLCNVGDKKRRDKLNPLSRFQRWIADSLERFIQANYKPFIQVVIRHRYLALAGFVGVLILSVGLVAGGVIRFVQFPNVPSDFINVSLEMAEGTPLEDTERAMARIDEALKGISRDAIARGEPDPVQHVAAFVGYSILDAAGFSTEVSSGSSLGSIVVELSKSEIRDSNAFEVSNDWRDRVGQIPGVRKLTFLASASGPVGLPVDIRLTGTDFDQLKEASLEIQGRLAEFEGLFDIRDTYSEGKREIKLKLKDNAELLGVNAFTLASQVRSAFYGAEAQRIQRDRDDVRIMIRYPEEDRRSVGNLEQMRIRTASGAEIPLFQVAEIETGVGFSSITRIDRKRVINIQADADKAVANTTEINAKLYGEILPEVLQKYPGIVSVKDGEARDFEELLPVLISGMIMVMIVIYALLAVPFKSYLQPGIVIFVVPFGIAGAILGHLINFQSFLTQPQDISILSVLGIIALSGVVVNDSLVLVDYINKLRLQGVPLREAVWQGGVARFRPIILTSMTTFVGLVPILLERSLQAQFLIPMATSLAFGVLFATFITLILVPCVYLILEDILWLIKSWWKGFRYTLTGKEDG